MLTLHGRFEDMETAYIRPAKAVRKTIHTGMERWEQSGPDLRPRGMSFLINQYVTDIQAKTSVIERKEKFFRISILAKSENGARSWCVYRWCTAQGLPPLKQHAYEGRKIAFLRGMLTTYGH